jgi:hypothetical protein
LNDFEEEVNGCAEILNSILFQFLISFHKNNVLGLFDAEDVKDREGKEVEVEELGAKANELF